MSASFIISQKKQKMTKIQFLVVFLLVLAFTKADQQVPLRKGEYGFSVGNKEGSLHIEFFVDFLCPDSKEAYNTMINVMKTIDFNQQGIKLTYQYNPLSWHFYSFKIHQAFFFIQKNAGPLQAEKFISYVFANQDSFAEEQWLDKTMGEFLDWFANTLAPIFKVDKKAFRDSLDGSQTWNEGRYHWKYTVGQNFVPGAPLFNINSVRVDGAQNFTASEWISTIQQFKKSNLVRTQTPLEMRWS